MSLISIYLFILLSLFYIYSSESIDYYKYINDTCTSKRIHANNTDMESNFKVSVKKLLSRSYLF